MREFGDYAILSASYRKEQKKVLNLYSTNVVHLKAYLSSMAFSLLSKSPPTELAFFLTALGPRYSND